MPHLRRDAVLSFQLPEMEDVVARLRLLLAQQNLGAALALLHEHHADDVRRYVAFLKRSASGDDLCQEVWLAAGRTLPSFRFQAMPRTWLFSIVRHRLAEERRRGRRRRTTSLPGSLQTLERMILAAPLGGRRPSTPSSGLRRKRRAAILDRELDRLAASDRELLEMRFVQGLKPADIVAVLGIESSPNNVSQRLLRLVRKLRHRLVVYDEFRAGIG